MSAFTDLLENINARRLYLVTIEPYAYIRGTFTTSATGNKFTGTGMFRGIMQGDQLQTTGPDSNNRGLVTVVSATNDELVVSGLTLTNQASHTRVFEGTVVRYYSTDGLVTTPTDVPANTWYDPRIEVALEFTRSMYQGSRIGGQSIPGFGQVTINNLDGVLDAYRSWGWAGRRITVEMGGEDFARNEYGTIFDGLTSGIELSDDFFTIEVRDLQAILDQDLWIPTYLGTGGTEGPVDLLGQYKPLTVGKVRNIEPTPLGIVRGRFTYQYSDELVNSSITGLNLDFSGPTPSLDSRITFTRASTATRFNSSGILETVASGVARFDHNPETLLPRGLLIEESRTNLLLRSSEFDNVAWTATRLTITTNNTVSPDGTTNADKLIATAVSGTHQIDQSPTLTAEPTTLSVYVKASGYNWAYLNMGAAGNAYFNVSTGVIGVTTGLGTTTIEPVGNGWYRCSITRTPSAGTIVCSIHVANANSGITFTGDGTSGIHVFGAQVETGTSQTSYIPTVGSTVTRAADVASLLTSSFAFNATEGSLVASGEQFTDITDEDTNTFACFSDGTEDNVIQWVASPADDTTNFEIIAVSAQQAKIPFSPFTGSVIILGGSWYQEGGGGSGIAIPTVTKLNIGSGATGTNQFNGWIRYVRYSPVSFSNDTISVITSDFNPPAISVAHDRGVPLIQTAAAPLPAGGTATNLSSAQYTYDADLGLVIVGGSEPDLLTLDTYQYKDTTNYSISQIMEYLVKERLRLDSDNSTSSITIGTGNKTLTLSSTFPTAVTGKILISLRSDPDNFWMYGNVVAWSNGTMTVNIDRTAGVGTYTDWVVTKIGLLSNEIVTDTFNALHTLNSSIAGIFIPSGGNALDILDELSTSIGAYYGFNREGKFEVGRLEDPTGTPDLVLDGEEVLSLTRENTKAPSWRIELGYNRNWRPSTSTDLAESVRANVVTNGTFDTATGWTFGTGWSFGNFVADAVAGSASNLSRTINLVQGQTYVLRIELTRSAGTLQPKLDAIDIGSSISASGIYEVEFTTTVATGSLIFSKDSSFVGSLDNVTIVAKKLKFFSNEYRTVTTSDTSIRSVYGPNAISERIDTFLDVQSDAQTECNRQLTLFSAFRDVFKVEAKTKAFSVDINSLVQLTDYRWGLENGKLFRVLEISENTSDNRVTLTLWG